MKFTLQYFGVVLVIIINKLIPTFVSFNYLKTTLRVRNMKTGYQELKDLNFLILTTGMSRFIFSFFSNCRSLLGLISCRCKYHVTS